ncbi:cytochrome P450 [Antrihabitans spumae]|uniref:Cytochrome P450 n=1 Tax=Antrihabitans spumae TaxID=3373370 RepID=A0ABW7KCQ9_9NOCA
MVEPRMYPSIATPLYPFAREGYLDPAPGLISSRNASGISRVQLREGGEAWLVTSYRKVRELLMSPLLGTQYPAAAPSTDDASIALGFMFLKDPPEHTRLRRAVSRTFTPAKVERIRSRATEVAQTLIERMISTGPPAELMADFAYPLPISIISELLGIPETDRARFRSWADIVLGAVTRDPTEIGLVYGDLEQFVVDLVDAKPDGDDLVSSLVMNEGGVDALTRREIYSMSLGLLMAGYVTTSQAIAAGVVRLVRRSRLLERIAQGEVAVPALVEELLRCQDEERGIQRIAQTDFDVDGIAIGKGDIIILSRAGANRDSEIFTRPDDFMPDRANPGDHLTFGHGPHRCLGAQLARMELEVSIAAIAAKMPRLRLAVAESAIAWHCDGMDVITQELPVTW